MATNPIFPPELFKEILDHLCSLLAVAVVPPHSPSPVVSKMQSLSLVCKTFLHLCRPIIFQHLDIGLIHRTGRTHSATEIRLAGLSQLLRDQPHLARHVRRLSGVFGSGFIPNDNGALTPLLRLPGVSTLSLHKNGPTFWVDPGPVQVPMSDVREYAFHTVLGCSLTSGRLTTLTLGGIRPVPIILILSCPTLRTLVLYHCAFFEDFALPSVQDTSGGFNLTEFGAVSTTEIPMDTILMCTRLERFFIDIKSSCATARHPLISPSPFDITNLPFSRLTAADLGGTSVDWRAMYKYAEGRDVPVLPLLKRLSITVEDFGDDPFDENGISAFYELLRHPQALTDLSLQGLAMNSVLVNQCLRLAPCQYSLRTLCVSWEFSYEPTGDADPGLAETMCGLLELDLPALEKFRLSINLGEGPFNDRLQEDMDELRLLKYIFVDKYDENFPSLKLLEIYLHLGVYIDEDPLSAQNRDLRIEKLTEEYFVPLKDIEDANPTFDFKFKLDIRSVENSDHD